ncbi:MAG TPA: DNA polymerase III subunit chi [Methylococcales bacterium]|jgi:DNA polymerase-3 subunit chi|nr:DNA polymerase III subunit chi [Methylococcales bacterium]
MPAIDFYILTTTSEQKRYQFVCKLAEKIFKQKQKAFFLTPSTQASETLDALLWTYKASSFIPHHIVHEKKPSTNDQLLIGDQSIPQYWRDTLVNLTDQPVPHIEKLTRIIEIIDANDAHREAGRHRYRHYKSMNLRPTTHKI